MTFLKPTLLLLLLSASVYAQKLPAKQQSSVRAPANIKIDGKLTEWNNQFQAYNKGNYIHYTVSNDDNNLYLMLRMDEVIGSLKILKGGLIFTVTPLSKKAGKLAVTYPVVTSKRADEMEMRGSPVSKYNTLKFDTVANKAKIDALISSSNQEFKEIYNQIQVIGISGTNNSLIPIDNKQGIQVGASYDNKMKYIYELAIPIKYLQEVLNNEKSFKYNIKLSAEPTIIIKPEEKNEVKRIRTYDVELSVAGPGRGIAKGDDNFLFNTTDFSGEYTLAK